MNKSDIEFVSGKLAVKILLTTGEIAHEFYDLVNSNYSNSCGKFWIFGRSIMFLTNDSICLFNKLGDKRPIVKLSLPDNFYNSIDENSYKDIFIPFGSKICEEYNKNYDKFKK